MEIDNEERCKVIEREKLKKALATKIVIHPAQELNEVLQPEELELYNRDPWGYRY